MIVFYTANVTKDVFILNDDDYRHCVKTLRYNQGDTIQAFDQRGKQYSGKINSISKTEVVAEIKETKPYNAIQPLVTIAMAPTKSPDRIEWALGKCVEIGVHAFHLIHTDRTERTRYKLDRLHRIALSSAKQSLNFKLPLIKVYDSLSHFVQEDDNDQKFIAHCLDPKDHLLNQSINKNSRSTVLIGPEGDFTSEEIALARNHNYKEINLGPTRLRTETAAVVALTLIQGKAYASK